MKEFCSGVVFGLFLAFGIVANAKKPSGIPAAIESGPPPSPGPMINTVGQTLVPTGVPGQLRPYSPGPYVEAN